MANINASWGTTMAKDREQIRTITSQREPGPNKTFKAVATIGIVVILVFLVIPTLTNLDTTAQRNIAERDQFDWLIKQRDCHVEPGRDVKWYGGTAVWKCADGEEIVSRFGSVEMAANYNHTLTSADLPNKALDETGANENTDSDSDNNALLDMFHSIFRFNFNTILLLILVVQQLMVLWKLKR